MSDTSPTEPTSSADETEVAPKHSSESESEAAEPAVEPSPASHGAAPAPRGSRLSRLATVAALVLAVIATTVAVLGWFYPHKGASSSSTTYSDQQTKEAKKHICETFMLVDHEVVRNSRLKNPENGGPIGALSIATAARLAFYTGGDFLRERVAAEPATPPELAKSVNAMAASLEELAIGYLAGSPEFTQDSLRQSLDDKIKQTLELCK
jgi:hypothetical protein